MATEKRLDISFHTGGKKRNMLVFFVFFYDFPLIFGDLFKVAFFLHVGPCVKIH